MATRKFTSFFVSNLRIGDLFSLVKSTLDLARSTAATTGGILQASFEQLETGNEAMGEQMDKPRKNLLTARLQELDIDRCSRFDEIRRNVSASFKSRDEAKKAAAASLMNFLKPHWTDNRLAMNTRTGTFSEMSDHFNADDALKAKAALIGITEMMAGLETANNTFDLVYKQRNAINAAKGPSARSLKSPVVKSYRQFCIAVEQALNLAPTPGIEILFGEMDGLRKTYARLIAGNRNEE